MKKVEEKIFLLIKEKKLFEEGDKLLIALSGGADSVFALRFLHQKKDKLGIKIAAAHINHQLRGKEADGDEEFCRKLCIELDVEFYSIKADVKKYAEEKKYSIEEAARELRYFNLQKIALKNNCDKIVTAHNLGDNTETVLHKLIKGTGLAGLSGIPAKRENIIRPFLHISREEILDYLNHLGQSFKTDESNSSNNYERNYLRNEVIPLLESINPSLHQTIFSSSRIFEESEKIIQKYTKQIFETFVEEEGENLKIRDSILEDDEESLGALLKFILKKKYSYTLNFENYIKIKRVFHLQTGKEIDLGKGLSAIKERGFVLITKKKILENNEPVELRLGEKSIIGTREIGIDEAKNEIINGKKNDFEIISADNTDDIFILRRWKYGDKFIPLGMKNFKKVSDFLNEQKIPANNKKEQFVLINRNNIIWVVGLRIDDRYKVNDNTERKYKLWIR